MKFLIITLLSLIWIFCSNVTNATKYYFSNNGEDSNNGISPVYPMKSVSKINEILYKMLPGDVLLLERGSIFYGQINLSSSGNDNFPVTIGAYGNGKNPVISGSVPVTDWSRYKGNIYSANVNAIVKNLFVNGDQMILARYPNSGYLTVDKPLNDPHKGFVDKELTQYEGYWKNSFVRIRTINWAYEFSNVAIFKNSALSFTVPTFYPVQAGWGYYMDNNLNELDTAKEWYFAKNKNETGTVYFYPPNGSVLNNLYIQASIYDYGIYSYSDLSNVIIRDITIKNQNEAGIYFPKSRSNIRIENCTFSGLKQFGINLPNGSENNYINSCRFYDINGVGLYLLNMKNSVISNNLFKNIGMMPGYGTTGGAYPMSAMYIYGNTNQIIRNYIDGVGHGAIHCHGSGMVIEKNIIKNCLLLLNDGGAIKCYGNYSKNSVWKNNFIYNVKGNTENTPEKTVVALGIYLDDLTNNTTVTDNTIVKSGFSGIGINDGYNNLIINNLCYDNLAGINFFQNTNSKNNQIIKNIIVGNADSQFSVDVKYLKSDNLPGKFDSNYYFNPGNHNSFNVIYRNVETNYNFENWKSFIRSDAHSKFFIGNDLRFPKLLTNMSDDSLKIILNSSYSYKDVNLNNIYGSVTLEPWTSEILFSNTNLNNLPGLYCAGGPLNFGNSKEGNISVPDWYCLTGENLLDPVVINAPDGFEISFISDADFANTISLNPVNGKVDKIIFVRFVPNKEKRYYDFILNKSGNLDPVLKVMGNSR